MDELDFWFGAVSMIFGAALIGAGSLFFLYGRGQTGLVQLLSYGVTVFLDLNGLAMVVNGLFHWFGRRSL